MHGCWRLLLKKKYCNIQEQWKFWYLSLSGNSKSCWIHFCMPHAHKIPHANFLPCVCCSFNQLVSRFDGFSEVFAIWYFVIENLELKRYGRVFLLRLHFSARLLLFVNNLQFLWGYFDNLRFLWGCLLRPPFRKNLQRSYLVTQSCLTWRTKSFVYLAERAPDRMLKTRRTETFSFSNSNI